MTFQSGFPRQPTNSITVSSAVSFALSYTSNLYQSVAMTTLGKSITEEDATKLPVLSDLHNITRIIKNDGGYPIGYRDNTGTLITSIAPGGILYASLKDNSTPAGVWSVTGTSLEPGLITMDSTFSSTYTSVVLAPYIAIDNNTSIHFVNLNAGFAAFIVDNAGKVVSTPVTVSATPGEAPVTVFKVDATHIICFYGAGTTTHKAVVITISGVSPALALAVGTAQALAVTSTAPWSGEDFIGATRVVQLTGTTYLSAYGIPGTGASVVAITVAGTTVTIGTPVAYNTDAGNAYAGTVLAIPLTATTALVSIKSAGTSGDFVSVVTVTGSTCSVGVRTNLNGTVGDNTGPSAFCVLSPTKVLMLNSTGGANTYVVCITITGTTSTAVVTSVEAAYAAGSSIYTANSATRYNPHLFPLTATTALMWYCDGSSVSRALTLTENAGTVTANAKLYASISSSTGIGLGSPTPFNATDFFALVNDLQTASKLRLACHKISGTTITVGSAVIADELPIFTTPIHYSMARLSSGDYIVGLTDSASAPLVSVLVARTNGDAINKRGSIRMPPLVSGTWPVAAVSSNRIVLIGSTQLNSTTVGASTWQSRLLNVEIAA
jgi:hypothetical protein